MSGHSFQAPCGLAQLKRDGEEQEEAETCSLLSEAGHFIYLRENIDFSLDAQNRAGLELYFERCAEAGLIPRARPLELVAAPGDAGVALHGLPRAQAAT